MVTGGVAFILVVAFLGFDIGGVFLAVLSVIAFGVVFVIAVAF
jgi:hypothetical protein